MAYHEPRFRLLDLRRKDSCLESASGTGEAYDLAAFMVGTGVNHLSHADISRNNVLIPS